MNKQDQSFSTLLVKGIDYMTEEYIKQLIMDVSNSKLQMLRPYVGTIRYPSGLFTPQENTYNPTVQFQGTMYLGYMEFLLPPAILSLSGATAYTKLTFELDGVERTFVQLTGGDVTNGIGVKFSQYVQSLFPQANLELPYNPNALHYLEKFKIEGSAFELVDGSFVATGYTGGVHTPNFMFQISCSGYSALVL